MNAKKLCTRAFTILLVMFMVIGMIPMSVLAVSVDDTLSASLAEAKSYVDGITINNSSNDPSTVVSTFKTHFTWDNEKRENSKPYLFDWSYYNGVVFEGIEYLYEVTGDETYKNYVVEYMSSLIKADGTWAYCTNSGYTSKQCAGYNSTHGADCYKTASLLLDAYEMTGDERYLIMAATLYTDLDSAAKSHSLSNAGNNYRHTWASDPSPDLWLDGLYMILPFRAEYAKYIGDTEELDLIVDRMQWVSDNMYNEDEGLFYHAADSATSNSGTHWLRSIGWYAAAIVDVMDSMDGENLEAMKTQLIKLVDGMIACQNTSNGMWLNNMAASKSSSNPYETSGTALVCYAIMKAVNNGWLDDSYAQYAILAFNGICNEKLSGSTLTDICFKGVPSGSNSEFYDNEGKGVGPFIMLYAEVLEYYNAVRRVVYTDNIIQITATGVGLTDIDAANVADDVDSKIADVIDTEEYYVAYDVELSAFDNFETVTYTMEIADGMPTTDLVLYHLADDGTLTPLNALMSAETDDYLAYLTFTYNTDGIFVYGTKKVVVDEDAKLESLDITSQPEVNAYFKTEEDDNPALDITGLVVKATFSDGQTKTIEWNEFGEVEDGYAITVDMTQVGEQDVEVSYTYGDVTKTATFKITVFDTEIADEETGVAVAPSVPGVTAINVTNNSEDETVKAALRGKVTTFTSYDIKLEGYTQGDKVVVTLPIPEGTVNPVVYYVPDDGSAAQKLDAYIYDDVVVFVTDHFTIYVVGDDIGVLAEGDSVKGEGNIAGESTYTLDTNGVTAGKKYLIVNSSSAGTRYALTNNNGTVERTAVTVSNQSGTRTITVSDDSKIAWTFSGTTSGTIGNNVRYVYPNQDSLSLNTSGTNLTISSQGSGAYRIYRTQRDGRTTYYYYLRYNNNAWTGGRTDDDDDVGTVYLYELTNSTKGAEVTFEVTLGGDNTIKVGEELELTGTVTVAGETVDLDDCTITWTTSDRTVATVSDGTVTGVADSNNETVYITATLSAYDETDLQEDIVISIPVYVQSKTVVEDTLELVGSPIKVVCGEDPDYSDVELVGEYDDGTEARIPYTALTFPAEVDTSMPGTLVVEVTYKEKTFDLVINCVNDYTGLDKAESIPEYPNDGAVRIDKTSTERDFDDTGVVEVELDVAGISVDTGVDVILIMDISNSMSWNDSTYSYADADIVDGSEQRLNIAKESATAFVNELLVDNTGNAVTDNSITVLAFAGIDDENFKDEYVEEAKANDDVYQVGNLAMTDKDVVNGFINNMVKAHRGGTNYDYAFQHAYSLAQQIYAKNGRNVYIVFMTDGAPTHYNGVYYKNRTQDDLDNAYMYTNPNTGVVTEYIHNGYDNNNNDVDYTAKMDITVYYNDGSEANKNVTYNKGWSDYITGSKNLWAEKVKSLDYVKHVYCIGFGMKNGSVTQGATSAMPTLNGVNGNTYYIPSSITHTVLQNIATVPESHFEADNLEKLTELYTKLAADIRYAGTAAQAHDEIGSKFTLQTTATAGTEGAGVGVVNLSDYGITPTISVKAYDLYPRGTADENGNDITGERTGAEPTVIEEITFSPDGTEAYSSEKGEGVNIMTVENGVTTIAAKYFTYTKDADGVEEFEWYIGNITDKEITLTFFAYLKGSLEGESPKTTYYTNEEATIEYIDINGDYASQTFPKPVVAWGGASTAYEFYLVNEDGQPCNRQGDVISFANRIIITGPFFDDLYLNQDEEYVSKTIAAEYVLPFGYTLYDETASYEVMTASGTHEGKLEISEPGFVEDENGTYKKVYNADNEDYEYVEIAADENYEDTRYRQLAQTTRIVSATRPSYIQSHVAFGVFFNKIPAVSEFELVPNKVVIDYGKAIEIDPAKNNTEAVADVVADGYTVEFIGFSKYYDGIDLKQQFKNTTARAPFPGAYGTFTMDGTKAVYTPNQFVSGVDSVFCVFEFTKGEDVYYMADPLHVIPATFVYYETDFADNPIEVEGITHVPVFQYKDNWTSVSLGSAADGPQDYKEIGTDLYGYDSTYTNDSAYSNGSTKVANGKGLTETYTQFAFTGTGFDLISGTGTAQGIIRVDIYRDAARTDLYKKVSVLNKSESNLTLVQIPVVSVNDLPYDTYYVTIGVGEAYENSKYPQLTRGNEFNFDAIRIYDPLNETAGTTETAIALEAYAADGEANNEIHEVRAMLLDTNEVPEGWIEGSYDDNDNEIPGVVYVDREDTGDGNHVAKLETYRKIGPNNEVYITGDQAIGFKITVDPNNLPTSIDIGAKSADGKEVKLYAEVEVNNKSVEVFGEAGKTISTSTSMYYDLMSGVDYAGATEIIVIIENYGEGILSITDLKLGYGTIAGTAVITSDTDVLYKLTKQAPKVEDTNLDVHSAEFTTETVVRKQKATIVVETSDAVESIIVTNAGGREENITVVSVETANGVKVWTVTLRITATGNKTFTVTGYNADGLSGATANATIEVTR